MTGGQPWIAQAPVFLVFVADFTRIAAEIEKRNAIMENICSVESTMVGLVDCGIAFGNAVNMAESLGYGIVPIGAIRREPYEAIELLELPKYVYPVVGMCIGVPDEMSMLKPRILLEIMVHNETYPPINQALMANYNQEIKNTWTKEPWDKM